jgi:hypothetical protein
MGRGCQYSLLVSTLVSSTSTGPHLGSLSKRSAPKYAGSCIAGAELDMLMRTAAVTAVVTLPLVAFFCFSAQIPFPEMSEVTAQANRLQIGYRSLGRPFCRH